MKALSLWQPYASLIACGVKTVETRPWRTHYRGIIAIHAAKVKPSRLDISTHLAHAMRLDLRVAILDDLPRQAIVCVADLVACEPTERFQPDLHEEAYGDFRPGRWAWVLANVRRLREPFPQGGRQGLWDLSLHESAKLEYELHRQERVSA